MSKKIIGGEEVREKILNGVKALAEPVTATLGAKGGNASIDTPFEVYTVNDGATIAGAIELPDPFENMGVKMLRTSALKASDEGGDGTTTATLLGAELIERGFEEVAKGYNPMILRKELQAAGKKVIKLLEEKSIEITPDSPEVYNIANVSSQDEVIASLIAEAYKKIGGEGIVTMGEANGNEHELDYTDGMDVKSGFLSPWFVTNIERMVSEIENPYVFVTDHKIGNLRDILPMLTEFKQKSNNIVIFAGDISPQALGSLVQNRKEGIFNVLAVKVPGYGSKRYDTLMDIAALTGANIISEQDGKGLLQATANDLGRADSIMATKNLTTIIGGAGDKEIVKQRVEQIKLLAEKEKDKQTKDELKKRAASLGGGIAILRLSARNDTEMRDLKLRADNGINAAKAAIEGGILPGGGVALLKIGLEEFDNKTLGDGILMQSLLSPIEKILANSGIEDSREIRNEIVLGDGFNYGYDVVEEKFGDMIEMGIVDPTIVEVSSIRNAVAVAATAITTRYLIAEEVDKEEK